MHKCCRKQLAQFNKFKKYIILKTVHVENEGDKGTRKVSVEEKEWISQSENMIHATLVSVQS